MKRITSKDLVIFVLALLAMGQAVVLGVRWRSRAGGSAASWLKAGDDLSGIHPVDGSGRMASFAGGALRVVLVFDSQCGHCRSVAPAWRDWIASLPADVSVVGVSTEAPESARAFVEEHGWGVEVWRVEGSRGSPEHALISRTPWVFVVDGEGRILAEGQGTRLAEVADAFVGAAGKAAGP